MSLSSNAILLGVGLLCWGASPAVRGQGNPPDGSAAASGDETQARRLLDEAKARMSGIHALIADYGGGSGSAAAATRFDRSAEITLERPNKFAIVEIEGAITDERRMIAASDGRRITRLNDGAFVAYDRPVHEDNFFLGQNFLVQFFFDQRPISFDPTDATWGLPVSLYGTDRSAYDRAVKMKYMGRRTLEGVTYEVVEIRYNTSRDDIRQQIYVGSDRLVYQVDTWFAGTIFSQKYRNFRINPALSADAFRIAKLPKMPLVDTDPVRLGEPAPDFTLPDYNGNGEHTLKDLLKDKKGLLVCVVDGTAAIPFHNADANLPQMRVFQELKDQFEKQGLVVVCIVGSPKIRPELVGEMKLNWMPNVSRFDYPIAIDVDLERGIQGSAFENFQLGNRRNLLLDKDARVVFACTTLVDSVNRLSLYQALAQIGFEVSPAELESAVK